MIEVLPEFMSRVQRDWQYGSYSKLNEFETKSCQFLADADHQDDFLSCNPVYLQCLLDHYKKDKFKNYKFENFTFIPQLNDAKKFVNHRDNQVILNFIEMKTKKFFSLRLQNSCNQKKLPKNIYSATTSLDQKFTWDNMDYDIYIDRSYITNLDVYRWASSTGKKKLASKYNSSKNFKQAAIDLDQQYQADVCEFHGGYLLESRVFDAATFFPNKSQTFYKFPLPWTKEKESFLSSEEELKLSDCKNAYVKGCEKLSDFDHFNRFSMSWMGIANALGGYPEHLKNIFFPKANLKLSSFYIERQSPWNRLGVRANWSGGNLFDFTEQYSAKEEKVLNDIKGVAFRCMRLR